MASLRFSVAASTLGLLASACTLLLNTAAPIQCQKNTDCDGNPSLRGRVCEEGFCVIPTAPIVPVSADAGPGCVTTELCTQANSGQASLCRKRGEPCIPIQTTECGLIAGAWSDPKAIFIGAIAPLNFTQADGSAPQVQYIQRWMRSVNLGLEEFNAASPQGILVGDERRPLAVLQCNSYADPKLAQTEFDHLVDVVRAPALIINRDEDLAAVTQKAIAKKIAIACSDCGAPIPNGPLAWATTPATALEAPLVAWRVADLETKIRAATGRTDALKVAVLAEGSAPAIAFEKALAPVLRFNDKSVTENGDNFLILTTGNPAKETIPHGLFAEQIEKLAPDILVVAMGSDFPRHFLTHLESFWPVGKPKPYYILTQLSYEVTPFVDLGTNDELRKRFSGTHPKVTPELRANIDAFTTAYRAMYNNQASDSSYSGYEAFYSLAYAITAASTKAVIDGPSISTGFESLVSGTTIDIRPDKLNIAMALLSGKATIDLRGLWSNLDWNTKTRELEGDAAMFCFTKGADGLMLKDDAGATYSTKTKQVTGSYSCD